MAKPCIYHSVASFLARYMDKNRIVFIYTLSDPNTNRIRYVGRTYRPQRRLQEHIWLAANKKHNPHKSRWINNLFDNRQIPVFEIIDEASEREWANLEILYVRAFKIFGAELLNASIGGAMVFDRTGLKDSEEVKKIKIKTNGKSKKVIQLDLEGTIIREWCSARQAALFHQVNRSHITECCRGVNHRKTVFGFKWKYVDMVSRNRKQVLKAIKENGQTKYIPFA